MYKKLSNKTNKKSNSDYLKYPFKLSTNEKILSKSAKNWHISSRFDFERAYTAATLMLPACKRLLANKLSSTLKQNVLTNDYVYFNKLVKKQFNDVYNKDLEPYLNDVGKVALESLRFERLENNVILSNAFLLTGTVQTNKWDCESSYKSFLFLKENLPKFIRKLSHKYSTATENIKDISFIECGFAGHGHFHTLLVLPVALSCFGHKDKSGAESVRLNTPAKDAISKLWYKLGGGFIDIKAANSAAAAAYVSKECSKSCNSNESRFERIELFVKAYETAKKQGGLDNWQPIADILEKNDINTLWQVYNVYLYKLRHAPHLQTADDLPKEKRAEIVKRFAKIADDFDIGCRPFLHIDSSVLTDEQKMVQLEIRCEYYEKHRLQPHLIAKDFNCTIECVFDVLKKDVLNKEFVLAYEKTMKQYDNKKDYSPFDACKCRIFRISQSISRKVNAKYNLIDFVKSATADWLEKAKITFSYDRCKELADKDFHDYYIKCLKELVRPAVLSVSKKAMIIAANKENLKAKPVFDLDYMKSIFDECFEMGIDKAIKQFMPYVVSNDESIETVIERNKEPLQQPSCFTNRITRKKRQKVLLKDFNSPIVYRNVAENITISRKESRQSGLIFRYGIGWDERIVDFLLKKVSLMKEKRKQQGLDNIALFTEYYSLKMA